MSIITKPQHKWKATDNPLVQVCELCGRSITTLKPGAKIQGGICDPEKAKRIELIVNLRRERPKAKGPDILKEHILQRESLIKPNQEYEPLPGLKLPPLWKQAQNYAIALFQHVSTGSKLVSSEVYLERTSICQNCPTRKRVDNYCGACGCSLAKKVTWADQGCPDKHWKAVTSDLKDQSR